MGILDRSLAVYLHRRFAADVYAPCLCRRAFSQKVPPLNKLWGVLKVGGILLAVGGAVTMAIAKGKDDNNDQNDTLGAILSLVNTILFGFYLAM